MERGISFSSTSSASTSSSTLFSDGFNSGNTPSSPFTGTSTPLSEIASPIDEEGHLPSTSKAPQGRSATILPDLFIDTQNVAPPAYNNTLTEANTPTDPLTSTSAIISQSQTLSNKSNPAKAPQRPTTLTRTQTAPSRASAYNQAAQPHPLSPLEHEYDPSKDDASIEELLARPRLPRSPYEWSMKTKLLLTMEEVEARGVAEAKKRAEDLERRKMELRQLALGVGSLKIGRILKK